MEAASARYAVRDRWAEAPTSQLLRFIQGSCSPENVEPNLALNLEIADLINSKKGTAPREAALAIVGYINHRNPNVALLALDLLDICVKNCGYPFYLQISNKEFLNELVRRFPERPPIHPSRVQAKILEAIEEWRSTICETSRYKEDLGFIRDMHRLLSYKGYSFPEVRTEDAAVLNPSDNLKSVEEMEEEEREAQSAKLQELIRRGAPEDLQEANRLMKIMAGYDVRSKTDYRAKAAEDVAKVQAKARLLEERLEVFRPGSSDKIEDGDVFGELAAALRSAQPKIQKMCEDESEDHDAVARLLDINDSIHRTLQRYDHMKKGDLEAANRVLGNSTDARGFKSGLDSDGGAAKELSLIDLDIEPDARHPPLAPENASAGLENDLLGLSMSVESMTTNEPSFGRGGGIALPLDMTNQSYRTAPFVSTSTSQLASHAPLPPQQNPQSLSMWASAPEASPSPLSTSNQQSPPGTAHVLASTPSAPTYATHTPHDDDEWSFSSALPFEATHDKPSKHGGVINNTDLQIEFIAGRATDAPAISLSFAFTNNTTRPITELHYQLAVTKGFELQLKPQTGRTLEPSQIRGVTQDVEVWHSGDRTRKVETIRLRWRVTYKVGGDDRAETGGIPELRVI